MKIKAKLVSGIGLLFVMVTLLTAIGSIFISKLSSDTKKILVANYNTIAYSRNMLNALNNGIGLPKQTQFFEENLNKQQQNITEAGEQQLTFNLTSDFSALKNTTDSASSLKILRTDISDIMLLNMKAIQRKSNIAQQTSENAIFWVEVIGALCFLISFTLLFNLPNNIANPIKALTNSIKQIAAQNYSQRLHFESHDEFGELAMSFNSMAEKLEEYRTGNLEKLLNEKKRIDTLINNMREPVIGLDAENKVLFFNDNALKITGLKLEDVLGKSIQTIAVYNDLIRNLIQELFVLGKEKIQPKRPPMKIFADNKESYFEQEIIPIKIIPTGEKEEIEIGNVILLKNITEYKELDFAKTNFIATVSHEFKTPISSIKMSLQLLENEHIGALNEEQKNLVESIKDDSNRLLKITSELLNVTQVESGSVQLNMRAVNVSEIMDYALNANKNAAEQKNIHLQVNLPTQPLYIFADKEKTAWVLNNIISNAIRYSYDHSIITITVSAKNNQVIFSVTDSGQGISPEYIPKIFDRYFRIPNTKKEGTGLGLSISKEFMEAQKGSIDVESEYGKGSCFSIKLPIAPH
ncbi:HAMP domain-containing sensor histidine kinase [Arachidicoccus soli]|uniref:histidine kinase n=1 Tax=Arachidicoccus soli TaxID=2341117 RepID=A0A386HS33_9BACT|nr:ATP-binding protein [Arachidicoccus soli]AYD48280.1 HAMP domain-containing protein [Arachidicoccus soli]